MPTHSFVERTLCLRICQPPSSSIRVLSPGLRSSKIALDASLADTRTAEQIWAERCSLTKNRKLGPALRSKTTSLPCGLFESVWCFVVAITANLDPPVAQSIRFNAPPKHWSSGELSVAFDAVTGHLSYFEQTPIWGAAYYAWFRKQIQRYLPTD
jgi:hypothetical protein